jgi:hypothetical protein
MLDAKTLRQFEDNDCWNDRRLRISDVKPDGSFVLWADSASVEQGVPEDKRKIIIHGKDSLDQATVHRIEDAKTFPLLHGCDFVIFDNAPIARKEYRGEEPRTLP